MAKLAPVKCLYCGQTFRREETEYVQVSKRYAHKVCAENKQKEDKIKEKTYNLVSTWLGSSLSSTKYNTQYKNLIKENKTPEGIYRALKYWIEVRKGEKEKANGGIAIVGYIYDEAQKYYDDQEKNKQLNKNVNFQELKQNLSDSIKVTIKPTPITKPKRMKFFILR